MKTSHKIITLFTLMLCFIFSLSQTAYADMGPKPSLTIIVENPPEGEYYLDLLVNYDKAYSKLTEETKAGLNAEKLKILEDFSEDGWYPALAHGTSVPLTGTVTGKKNGDTMVHGFSYLGVPDTFKVIIVTAR